MSEDFRGSATPSAAATTIKVSLDEWAIVDRRAGAELMTDGLSGCVAVGIRTADKLALTHVYSGALDDFESYKQDLTDFVARVGGKHEISEVHIMHNGNPVSEKHGTHLQGMIEKHLVDSDAVDPRAIHRHRDNGCAVADAGFYAKDRDNRDIYLRGYTNTALEGVSEADSKRLSKTLSGDRFACSKDYAGPSEIDSAVRNGAASHAPSALYAPKVAEVAPSFRDMGPSSSISSSSSASPSRGPITDDPIYKEIYGVFRDQKLFGFNKVSIAGAIAEHVIASGTTGIDNIKVNAERNYATVSTRDRGDLNFEISGSKVTPAPSESRSAPTASLPSTSSTSLFPPPPASLLLSSSVPPSSVPPSFSSSSTFPPLSSPSMLSGPPMPMPSSPMPSSLGAPVKAPNLYEQAVDALRPHQDALKLSSPQQIAQAAEEIASQARSNGLTAISRLEPVAATESRGPTLIAHQDGPSSRQSDPIDIAALQRHAGVATVTPQQQPDAAQHKHL